MKKIDSATYNEAGVAELITLLIDNQNEIIDSIKYHWHTKKED